MIKRLSALNIFVLILFLLTLSIAGCTQKPNPQRDSELEREQIFSKLPKIRLDKVYHYKIAGLSPDDEKNPEKVSWEAEYWIDYKNKRAKSVFRNLDFGYSDEFNHIKVVQNNTTKQLDEINDKKKNFTEQSSSGSDFNALAGGIFSHVEKLKNKKSEFLGEDKVDDIEVLVFSLIEETGERHPDGSKPIDVYTFNIRKDNYFPLAVLHVPLAIYPGGRKERMGFPSQNRVFGDVELLDLQDFDSKFFSLEIPDGIPYHITKVYSSLEELRSFEEFDLYYLGKSFEGYKLLKGEDSVWYDKYDEDGKGKSETRVEYSYSKRDDSRLGIMLNPSNNSPNFLPEQKVSNIKIKGKPAKLIERKTKRETSYILQILLGNAWVSIDGQEKDIVIKAAESLKKFNK